MKQDFDKAFNEVLQVYPLPEAIFIAYKNHQNCSDCNTITEVAYKRKEEQPNLFDKDFLTWPEFNSIMLKSIECTKEDETTFLEAIYFLLSAYMISHVRELIIFSKKDEEFRYRLSDTQMWITYQGKEYF